MCLCCSCRTPGRVPRQSFDLRPKLEHGSVRQLHGAGVPAGVIHVRAGRPGLVNGLNIVVFLVPPIGFNGGGCQASPPVTSTCPFGMIETPEQKILIAKGIVTSVTLPVEACNSKAAEWPLPTRGSGLK